MPGACGQRAFAVFKGGKKSQKNRVLGAEWLGVKSVSCGHAVIIETLHQLCVFKLFFFFLKQHMLNIQYDQ